MVCFATFALVSCRSFRWPLHAASICVADRCFDHHLFLVRHSASLWVVDRYLEHHLFLVLPAAAGTDGSYLR